MIDINEMGLMTDDDLKEISHFNISEIESVDAAATTNAAAGAGFIVYGAMAAVV
ncbi:hypothetical protein KPL40_19120 [Clostridium gasigenes]|uniref:hypothetical protein n=1 Tax=Clostridium gasigenes TaxID=94869 RepID=UPI001C0C9033|nr:hypothetical protein [Clostridium gasigenes]MBU3134528.1 hypothetical protein [Clostridium gasigenes]